jgi:chaperonin cofactor prefoldin
MKRMNYVRKQRLVEWETIMTIVRKEVEPREYGGDLDGAKQVLEKLPQDDGFVLKKWGDVLFKEAQKSGNRETAEKALAMALSAERAFPQARYKHEARKLQESIRTWMASPLSPPSPAGGAAVKE